MSQAIQSPGFSRLTSASVGEAHKAELQPSPAAATAPARRRTTAERLEFELAPILAAQRRLIGAVRVIESLSAAVERQHELPALRNGFDASLRDACSTWCDPICDGQAWEVVEGLARVAEDLCGAIVAEGQAND